MKFECFKFGTFKFEICFPGPSERIRAGDFRALNFVFNVIYAFLTAFATEAAGPTC